MYTVSDSGPQFTFVELYNFAETWEFWHVARSFCHPTSNGRVLADYLAKWRDTVHEQIMGPEARRHELAAETRCIRSERSAAQQEGANITEIHQREVHSHKRPCSSSTN